VLLDHQIQSPLAVGPGHDAICLQSIQTGWHGRSRNGAAPRRYEG
jgi:hypothetical protein